MPWPYVLVAYGPLSICMAWFVTLPVLFATGAAVAFACAIAALGLKIKAQIQT